MGDTFWANSLHEHILNLRCACSHWYFEQYMRMHVQGSWNLFSSALGSRSELLGSIYCLAASRAKISLLCIFLSLDWLLIFVWNFVFKKYVFMIHGSQMWKIISWSLSSFLRTVSFFVQHQAREMDWLRKHPKGSARFSLALLHSSS